MRCYLNIGNTHTQILEVGPGGIRLLRTVLTADFDPASLPDDTELFAACVVAEKMDALRARGVRFENISSVEQLPKDKKQKIRVTVASELDSFNTAIVRGLGIEGARNGNIIFYGTARMRTNGISQTDLHSTEAHMALSYFIDYDDPAVRQFVLSYRSLFQGEPGSFAFQGYDTTHYFVTLCAKYGRQWYKKLDEYAEKGLQADFRFREEPARVNQAARRVVYNSDLTTERRYADGHPENPYKNGTTPSKSRGLSRK